MYKLIFHWNSRVWFRLPSAHWSSLLAGAVQETGRGLYGRSSSSTLRALHFDCGRGPMYSIWLLNQRKILQVMFTKDSMEQQQHGLSDSMPRAGSDRLKKSTSLLSVLKLMSVSQSSTQKYGSSHFDPFYIARKIRPI